MILRDVALPRLDARAVLTEIKTVPQRCAIPVVVLTTSIAVDAVTARYTARVNAYIAEPGVPAALDRVVALAPSSSGTPSACLDRCSPPRTRTAAAKG